MTKPLTDYVSQPQNRDKLSGSCRACINEARNVRRRHTTRERGWPTTVEGILWLHARARARQRGMAATIRVEDIHAPDVCPCLGIPLSKGSVKHHDGSPTIDRIDSAKGYTPENIWVISRRANVIKSDATLAELEMIVAALKRVR